MENNQHFTLQIESLHEMEQKIIERVMQEVGGNVTKACKILKVARSTIYKRGFSKSKSKN